MRSSYILIFMITMAALVCDIAFAVPVSVKRRDQKLATQQLVEKQTITDAVVADDNRLLVDIATSSSVTTTTTTFLAQPDVARAISILPSGTTADVPAGDIVITGTSFFGNAITEALTLTANQTGIEIGTKAFLTVTQVVFPIQDGASATYDFGVIDVLGLKRCMDVKGHVLMATFDGAREGTEPTCLANATLIESNTCDINGTLNGAKDIELFFFQNFRCFP